MVLYLLLESFAEWFLRFQYQEKPNQTYKKKNEDTITGWRPNTLLNTSYEIIAKALAIRIKLIV